MRFGQITFTTPLHCMAGRSEEFGMIFPAESNGSYSGTILPVLSTSFLKSPLRNSSSGSVTSDVDCPFLVEACSYAKKKNALFNPNNSMDIYIDPQEVLNARGFTTSPSKRSIVVNPRALKTSLRLK